MKSKMKSLLFLLVFGITFAFFSAGFVFSDGYFDGKNEKEEPMADVLNLDRQAYVGLQQFAPIRDGGWVNNCLNLGSDIHKFGVKIIAYRIQWFSGSWSGWFVPGMNDLYKKDGEPLRRQWACFNDHNFEIMYTAPKKVEWKTVKKTEKEEDDDYVNW